MRKLLISLAALVVGLGLGLVGLASPAQAIGWSGQRCDNSHTGPTDDGWRMCTQFHTVSLPNGKVWIDAIQVCMTMVRPNNHIQKAFQNGWGATGGAWGGLPNVQKNSCGYSNPTKVAGSMGAGACYWVNGRIDRSPLYPDTTWHTSGRVQGGAC